MPVPLSAAPVMIELQVNEWLSIRKPGRYRISAETTRVVTADRKALAAPVRSNSIEIDVAPPEAGWANEQLRQAVAVLQIPDAPSRPQVGQTLNLAARQAAQDNAEHAARTLRFLETPEAARELARFFEHGPTSARRELEAGLFATPYRKEAMDAMEASFLAPDFPITATYLGTLVNLAKITELGPVASETGASTAERLRWTTEVNAPYQEKAKPIRAEYEAKLANAIGMKRGEALAVTLQTLVTNGMQPAAPATTKAFAASFGALPENSQHTLLSMNWPSIASPDLIPALQSIAEGSGIVRDAALFRLQELAPDIARKITIDRILKTDISRDAFSNERVLWNLPDKTLPEVDDALVRALEQGKPAGGLVDRYASDAALPRLKALVARVPRDQVIREMCSLAAYFFRVDPEWAATEVAQARQGQRGACALSNEYLPMSPGLEKQAIRDLTDPNSMNVRNALTLLQYGGSAAAKGPMLDAFARLHATGINTADRLSVNLDLAFATALVNANAWLPTEELLAQVEGNCLEDQCKRQAASARRLTTTPIGVTIGGDLILNLSEIGFGPQAAVRSIKQFEARVALYPKGTPFYLEGNNRDGWWFQQYAAQARKILESAEMKVVDRPVRPAAAPAPPPPPR